MTKGQALDSAERRWRAHAVDRGPVACWPWAGCINPETGYGQLALASALVEDGWPRTVTAPWFACRVAQGPPPTGGEVLHSCNVRDCCNPAHLRWGTRAENAQDRAKDGHQNTGKLTPDEVRSIRREFANRSTGKMVAYADLGAKYGISDDGVRRIIYGETWAWLE